MKCLLEVKNLSGGYSDTKVVDNISMTLSEGMILGVFGRNGVGKSTLAKLLQGYLMATGGTIILDGKDITHKQTFQRRREGFGYMPQTQMVFDELTVKENLNLTDSGKSCDYILSVFTRLKERMNQKAGKMSGGERKILGFARVMVEQTKVIILDEPSEGVQSENILLMQDVLKQLKKEGVSIILIEQNFSMLHALADHYLGIDTGKVVIDKKRNSISEEEVLSLLSI